MELREKRAPKYREPRITWVEITPKMKKEILSPAPGYQTYTAIGKTILYSAEALRKVFVDQPDRVNKTIWDAIMVWYSAKNGRTKAETKPAAPKKKEPRKEPLAPVKPRIAPKQGKTEAVNSFLAKRRAQKLSSTKL